MRKEPSYDTLVDKRSWRTSRRDHEVERLRHLCEVADGHKGRDKVGGSSRRGRGATSCSIPEEAEAVERAAVGCTGAHEAGDGVGVARKGRGGGEGGKEAEDEVGARGPESGTGCRVECGQGGVEAEVGG